MPEASRRAAHFFLGGVPGCGDDPDGPYIVKYDPEAEKMDMSVGTIFVGVGMTLFWLIHHLAAAQGVHPSVVRASLSAYLDGDAEGDPDWLVGPPTEQEGQRFRETRRALQAGEDDPHA